jgi:hypothetical protein
MVVISIGSILVQTKNPKNMSFVPNENLTSSNLVPLDVVQESIRRYMTRLAPLEDDPTYAFLINHEDIVQALGLSPLDYMEYERLRVYFGLADEDQNFKMRLFLVPVNNAGEDVLPVVDGKQYVYDFNLPCPATCDVTSPLYYGNL